jgi:2-methylcitrate dehydratase PrpD
VRRREFIGFFGAGLFAADLATWPLAVRAQQSAQPVIGGGSAINPAHAIAEFVVNFDLKNAPPIVVDRARVAFVDTIGVTLAGSQLPPADIVCDMIKLEGSAAAATIVGRSLRASPQLAALANGVSAHAMDYDLTYFSGQSIAGLIPAILPVAETTGASPSEMLSAFIIGAEVCGRVSRAAPTMSRTNGWHATGTVGTMAVAAACARLLKAPVAAIPDIMGITASLASGVSANFGTMTKPLHSGHAARDGILAVLLGARGFTASASALEGRDGFFDNFARGLDWSLEPFKDLGKSYDLAQYGYKLKPYPSGGLGHTAIDAALELRGSVPISDIASVEVAITKYALRRYTSRYPRSVENAKFSGPYLAAYTLVHGAPMLAAFTEEALRDEAVRALASKVALVTYQEYADVLEESPAKVTITLADGRKIERAKYYPSGSVQMPMTKAQIEEKFIACATTAVEPDAAKKILAMLSTLGEQQAFNDFWPLLRKG